MEHEPRDVAGGAGAPVGLLDEPRQLVHGQVVRTADLPHLAASVRVVDHMVDQRRDVGHRDEVDQALSATEDERPAASRGGLPHDPDPQLGEGGGTHDRGRRITCEKVLFGCVLHPEQLHRAVRRRADDRQQDDVCPDGPGSPMRRMLPSRSTVAGEMPRGPTKPWAAATTLELRRRRQRPPRSGRGDHPARCQRHQRRGLRPIPDRGSAPGRRANGRLDDADALSPSSPVPPDTRITRHRPY